MGLRDEIESRYTDANWQVNPFPVSKQDTSRTGNGLSYTALYYWLLHRRGESTDQDIPTNFFEIVNRCVVPNYPGLLNRSPQKIGDQEGWDDYVMLLSVPANIRVPWTIYSYSKKVFCSFNNSNPGKFTFQSFFARYPIFMAHLRFANGFDPWIGWQLYWCFGVILSFFSKDATNIVLHYMAIQTMMRSDAKSTPCKVISNLWLYLRRNNPMKNVVAMWLSVDNKDGVPVPNLEHPIVKYWKD